MSETRKGARFAVRDLIDGDVIDLLELGEDYPLDETTRMVAECELAVVISDGDDETPFVVESATCWVLTTDQGCFGVDPGWQFMVRERVKR